MSGSSVGRIFLLVVGIAAIGGGLFVWKIHEENRKLSLEAKERQAARAQTRMEHDTEVKKAEAASAQAKAKAAEARAAEDRRRTSENERRRAAEDRAAKEAAVEAEKVRLAAAKAETTKAEAQKAAAEAEIAKAAAQKAAAEASRADQEKKVEAETLALKRAAAEQKKAEAEAATAMAEQRKAEAARETSENERKTAEANAAAAHDHKLRIYQRAGGSRAELLALKRAEKLLALEESGALAGTEGADEDHQEGPEEVSPSTVPATNSNAVVAVSWPDAGVDPALALIESAEDRQEAKDQKTARQHARAVIRKFSELADLAEKEGRATAAEHHRKSILVLVPGYVEIYADLIKEKTGFGKDDVALNLVTDLFKVVPEWERVDVIVQLLERDDEYFARAVAGRVPKSVYVAAFRKYFDRVRRDTDSDGPNGTDPREEKMQHIRGVLARYVPDYEKVYEWSGRYSTGNDE